MIALPYTITSGTVVVVNDIGQVTLSAPFQNKNSLPIGDHVQTPGIYYYRITDHISGEVFAGRYVHY